MGMLWQLWHTPSPPTVAQVPAEYCTWVGAIGSNSSEEVALAYSLRAEGQTSSFQSSPCCSPGSH